MHKKDLSESDLCDKYIRPAMERAGWHGLDQIFREFPLRAGRVVVRGNTSRRDPSTVLRADQRPSPPVVLQRDAQRVGCAQVEKGACVRLVAF